MLSIAVLFTYLLSAYKDASTVSTEAIRAWRGDISATSIAHCTLSSKMHLRARGLALRKGPWLVVPEGSAMLISLHEHMKALPRPFDMDDALSQPYGMIPYV